MDDLMPLLPKLWQASYETLYIVGPSLGTFAIQYGYRQFHPVVTWAAVLVIIVIVQLVQFLGNYLARKALRR